MLPPRQLHLLKIVLSGVVITGLLLTTSIQAQELSRLAPLPHRVFRVNNRSADSVVDLFKLYLSKEGRYVVDSRLNAVIVIDHKPVLEKIETLIRDADIPRDKVTISVNILGYLPVIQSGIFTSAIKTKDNWIIGLIPEITPPEDDMESLRQITLITGTTGFIKIGDINPEEDWLREYPDIIGILPGARQNTQLSRGFFLNPVVSGKTIEIRIAPGILWSQGTSMNRIILRDAETSVVIRDGNTIAVGVVEPCSYKLVGLISRITGVTASQPGKRFTFQLKTKLVTDKE